MKKYIVEVSETAEQDLENIISYFRYNSWIFSQKVLVLQETKG